MHGVSRHVVASFSFLYSVCLPPHLSSMSINAVGNEKSKEMGNKKKSLYIIYFSFFFLRAHVIQSLACLLTQRDMMVFSTRVFPPKNKNENQQTKE
jgi:undecaprenyl pyrophosphate phosphatase UppP